MITQEELKQYVTYDPETGLFRSTGSKYSNKKEGEIVGSLHKTKGYIYLTLKGKTYRAQRVAFLYMTGAWPSYQVDHINQNKADNRWSNLREATPMQNCHNRPLYKTNSSGQTGVVRHTQTGKWMVLCRSNGQQHYGGLFESLEEASLKAKEIYATIR